MNNDDEEEPDYQDLNSGEKDLVLLDLQNNSNKNQDIS